MLIAFILGFLVAVISFCLGLVFTVFLSKSDVYDRVMDRAKEAAGKGLKSEIGLVKRPTAADLRITKPEEETEEEMSKVLRNFYKKEGEDDNG